MIRNAKTLGLAIVAVLAITAVMASAAGAANFTAAKYPVSLAGGQIGFKHKFSVGGSTVSCASATFAGTTGGGPSETQVMYPTYSSCTAFGFGAAIRGFGALKCSYQFYANGKVDLVCPSGMDVVIDAGPCLVTLKGGTFNDGLSSNTYTNGTPTAARITIDTNITNIHAEVTSHFGCPIAGGTYSNATYTGTTEVGGTSEGKEVQIDVG